MAPSSLLTKDGTDKLTAVGNNNSNDGKCLDALSVNTAVF